MVLEVVPKQTLNKLSINKKTMNNVWAFFVVMKMKVQKRLENGERSENC